MLRTLRAASREGRAALAALAKTRSAPELGALTEALPIVRAVLEGGEPALRRLVARFDRSRPRALRIDPSAGEAPPVDRAFAAAFRLAARRVRAYHRRQLPRGFAYRDRAGVSFVERPVPHDAVGVYVPGGRAFYPSSLLMGTVPARVAGVGRVVVATPPRAWDESPELRWAARELRVDEVLLAGGAHGIAGLVSLCGCTKVVGPGNRWVAAAKHLLSAVVSVDLPAGPSEVLVVASGDSDPERIAADLLAQAEHDPDAVCLLFTDAQALVTAVARALDQQLPRLSTPDTARRSLDAHGLALVFPSLDAAAREARSVAAEHVQLFGAAERYRDLLMATAGAVFVGSDTPTALGDYLAGPNHVLPTGGAARSFSGLSTRDFFRYGRSVKASRGAARRLAPSAATLARFEGLEAHARSLLLRAR